MALIRDFAEFWYIHLPVWGLSVVGAWVVMRRAAPLIGRAWLAGLAVLLLALLVWALASFAVGRLLDMVHSAQGGAAGMTMVETGHESPRDSVPYTWARNRTTIGAGALQNLAPDALWSVCDIRRPCADAGTRPCDRSLQKRGGDRGGSPQSETLLIEKGLDCFVPTSSPSLAVCWWTAYNLPRLMHLTRRETTLIRSSNIEYRGQSPEIAYELGDPPCISTRMGSTGKLHSC